MARESSTEGRQAAPEREGSALVPRSEPRSHRDRTEIAPRSEPGKEEPGAAGWRAGSAAALREEAPRLRPEEEGPKERFEPGSVARSVAEKRESGRTEAGGEARGSGAPVGASAARALVYVRVGLG